MAEDTKPAKTPQTEDDDDGSFHYYSGGEIKELAGTRVAPVLWLFYSLLIVFLVGIALWYFTVGKHSVFPTGMTRQTQMLMQAEIDQSASTEQVQQVDQRLDLSRIPLPEGQTVDQAVSAGADVYQTYCFGCHGPNQDGNGVNAAALNPKPRNLRDEPFMQAMSYMRISTSVHKGVPGTAMPRWENSLTDTQMKDVIAYVLSLTAPTEPTPAPDSSASATPTAAGAASAPAPSTPTSSAPTSLATSAASTASSTPSTPASQSAAGNSSAVPAKTTAPASGTGQ